MRDRLRPALLSLLVFAGAFALGGCEEDDEEDEVTNGGTLIIDDDRTTGLPMTVFIALGAETPTTITLNAGQTQILTVTQGSYTITFDDDGTAGIVAPSTDTKKTGVQVLTNKTTSVEYTAVGDADTSGPSLSANG